MDHKQDNEHRDDSDLLDNVIGVMVAAFILFTWMTIDSWAAMPL